MTVKILILCTGNSCRSQMAEAFLRNMDERLWVRSGGTAPSSQVHPLAVRVMAEKGIDLSGNRPTHVDSYRDQAWDYVITVCGHARESCPVFHGDVKERLHIGFDDPAEATGSEEQVLQEFRRIRDEILGSFSRFYHHTLVNMLTGPNP